MLCTAHQTSFIVAFLSRTSASVKQGLTKNHELILRLIFFATFSRTCARVLDDIIRLGGCNVVLSIVCKALC